jgi:hypothetical protein
MIGTPQVDLMPPVSLLGRPDARGMDGLMDELAD